MQHHKVEAPGATMLALVISTVLFFPTALLALVSGFAFYHVYRAQMYAILVGTTSVTLGVIIGSVISFLVGKYLYRDQFSNMIQSYKMGKQLDKLAEKQGLWISFILHICPLVPFSILNYVFGASSMTLADFILGSLGMIPGNCLLVYLGTNISNLTSYLHHNRHTLKHSKQEQT
jgi:uncharacterized membrane protein YdjX (TVP38/TMEM64 family)